MNIIESCHDSVASVSLAWGAIYGRIAQVIKSTGISAGDMGVSPTIPSYFGVLGE